MSPRSSFRSAYLYLEQFEARLCLSGGPGGGPGPGPNSGATIVSVLQSTQGANAVPQLIGEFQAGIATAKGLIQSMAGADNFEHVIIDTQLVTALVQNKAITSIELELSSSEGRYAGGDSSAAAEVSADVDRTAFAAGFLNALSQDYSARAVADLSHLNSLGAGVVPAIAASIQSIDDAGTFIVSNINTTVGQSSDDFGQPHGPDDFATETETETESGHDSSGRHG
jgi:hypothetical protein